MNKECAGKNELLIRLSESCLLQPPGWWARHNLLSLTLHILSQSLHRFGPCVIQKGIMYETIKCENVIPLAITQNDLLHGWNKLPTENVMGNARALPA